MRWVAGDSAQLTTVQDMAVTEAGHRRCARDRRPLPAPRRRRSTDTRTRCSATTPTPEDVTQTTFLNAYRALEQGVRPRKPSNWLLTIASNAIKQRFRQEQARPRQVELDDAHRRQRRSDDDGPSVGELLTALSKIPPQQRQAIVLREFEGRSYAEIAEILGVTTTRTRDAALPGATLARRKSSSTSSRAPTRSSPSRSRSTDGSAARSGRRAARPSDRVPRLRAVRAHSSSDTAARTARAHAHPDSTRRSRSSRASRAPGRRAPRPCHRRAGVRRRSLRGVGTGAGAATATRRWRCVRAAGSLSRQQRPSRPSASRAASR